MAFDYGKDTLGIKNPYTVEGYLDLVQGLSILIIGLLLLLNISADIDADFKTIAWLKLTIAISFLVWSISSIIKGSFSVFRFLVGRNVPANLCRETTAEPQRPYSDHDLAEMLKKRTNYTFVEKKNFYSRFVISIIPNFLFLMPAYRNMIDTIAVAVIKTVITILIYFLSVFTVSSGLLPLNNSNVILEWYGMLLCFYILTTWYKNRPLNTTINDTKNHPIKIKTIVIPIVIAIILPIVLSKISDLGVDFISLNITVFWAISCILLAGLVTTFVAFYLAKIRVDETVPNTAVSEYKDELQLNHHPRDLFRFFDLEMADKRYKELPNRIYKLPNPVLQFEGAQNKGNFFGETIQETQPIYKPNTETKAMQQIRFIVAILGRLLAIMGCLIIYLNLNSLRLDYSLANYFNTFFFSAILFTFYYYLCRISHLFWGEIQFTSHLVHFFSEGTFNESKIATGMSVYDSTRSENTIMHTKSTSWIFVSEIVTSTIADTSTNNLEANRYILEMHKDENFLTDVINRINSFIDKNKVLAGLNSTDDIEHISNMNGLNQITKTESQDTIGELRNNEPKNLKE